MNSILLASSCCFCRTSWSLQLQRAPDKSLWQLERRIRSGLGMLGNEVIDVYNYDMTMCVVCIRSSTLYGVERCLEKPVLERFRMASFLCMESASPLCPQGPATLFMETSAHIWRRPRNVFCIWARQLGRPRKNNHSHIFAEPIQSICIMEDSVNSHLKVTGGRRLSLHTPSHLHCRTGCADPRTILLHRSVLHHSVREKLKHPETRDKNDSRFQVEPSNYTASFSLV